MKTIAPIEDKDVLEPFYETQALILQEAASYDEKYLARFEKILKKMEKLGLDTAVLRE